MPGAVGGWGSAERVRSLHALSGAVLLPAPPLTSQPGNSPNPSFGVFMEA